MHIIKAANDDDGDADDGHFKLNLAFGLDGNSIEPLYCWNNP